MEKTQIQAEAQCILMRGLQKTILGIDIVPNEDSWGDEYEVRNAAVAEFRRIEKLLGYSAGTWNPLLPVSPENSTRQVC